jgi:rare lipoprotein A (peptidoglycan hydrolase)
VKRLAHTQTYLALALAACLALPAAAAAGSGGTTPGAGEPPAGGTAAPGPGDATLQTPPGALLRRSVRLTGQAQPGRQVAIQRLDSSEGWVEVAQTAADGNGAFSVVWRPDVTGRVQLRAVPGGSVRAAANSPGTAALTVFRPGRATWYGPGFYGKRTSCGRTMTTELVGVAHRTLPCGTRVRVYYRGRTIVAPVVDRGPFANGASWDLTAAAARAVGMTQTSTIGVLARGLR